MNRQIDKQTYRQPNRLTDRFSEKKNVERKEEHRQTDERTNRQIDQQTYRQANRQTD